MRNSDQVTKLSVGLSTTTDDTNIDAEDNSTESGKQVEAGRARADEMLNTERLTTALRFEIRELAEISTPQEFDEVVPFSLIVQPEVTASEESPYNQVNFFNQIEILSRKLLYLIRKGRKPMSDAQKQSRLEALLVELNQILVEEW